MAISKLSIRKKIMLCSLPSLLFMVGISIITLMSLQENQKILQQAKARSMLIHGYHAIEIGCEKLVSRLSRSLQLHSGDPMRIAREETDLVKRQLEDLVILMSPFPEKARKGVGEINKVKEWLAETRLAITHFQSTNGTNTLDWKGLKKRVQPLISHNTIEILVSPLKEAQESLSAESLNLYNVAQQQKEQFTLASQVSLILAILVTALFTIFISGKILHRLHQLVKQAKSFIAGDYSVKFPTRTMDEVGQLGVTLNTLGEILLTTNRSIEINDWIKTGDSELNARVRGDQNLATLMDKTLEFLAKYLNAQMGAVYLAIGSGWKSGRDRGSQESNAELELVATYAFHNRKSANTKLAFGEGLVGQAALEKKHILLTDVPSDYLPIQSSLGSAIPATVLVFPLLLDGEIMGVLELAKICSFSKKEMDFLNKVGPSVAIAINSSKTRNTLHDLLSNSQAQSEELQAQQEELRMANEELEDRSAALEKEKSQVNKKNKQLEDARIAVEKNSRVLKKVSQYKSEFLANMSHELRTPLNSQLILSKIMLKNKTGNLTDKQVEYAQTIHNTGQDLLNLINEILDLSKIESGKMEVMPEEIQLDQFLAKIDNQFRHIAEGKGLDFVLDIADQTPVTFLSDEHRVGQIMKNLLSNAFKFTESGEVKVTGKLYQGDLPQAQLPETTTLQLTVSDTGIGVPENKRESIFQAFEQVDGTTERKYGGTGLGLTICREIAQILGGELHLGSTTGRGSQFHILLPLAGPISKTNKKEELPVKEPEPSLARESSSEQETTRAQEAERAPLPGDDREKLKEGDKVLLIVEDDTSFAAIIAQQVNEMGFKAICAGTADEGIELVEKFPPMGIILDLGLPGMDGTTFLQRMKECLDTRHIPVHVITGRDDASQVLTMGAIGCLKKPIEIDDIDNVLEIIDHATPGRRKKILLVEDMESISELIIDALKEAADIEAVDTGEKALKLLQSNTYDCMILDLGLPGISGMKVLKSMREMEGTNKLPVIVITGEDLAPEERAQLDGLSQRIIKKGDNAFKRLLDDTTLFLHSIIRNLPREKQRTIELLHDKDLIMSNKMVLIVDDDPRNIFALTQALEEKNIQVKSAENGKVALKVLADEPEIDLVLLDIMMPEMDGYETAGQIRKQAQLKDLPVIALTAKAMKGDRTKCIQAGCSDYLSKPVDLEKLFSILRVWLYQDSKVKA